MLHKKAEYIPPLDEKYLTERSKVVLLFNPSPLSATFTSNQTGRHLASNGADFDGWTTYNAKGFTKMLEGEGN